jgi:ABC-type glutathione transport system ATPase component
VPAWKRIAAITEGKLSAERRSFFSRIDITLDIGPASGFESLRTQAMNQAAPPFALEIRGLAKRFEKPAVDGLDLRVRVGEFYTLLGPNGAGKTTTLRMVTGLLKPDRGSIAVFGIDVLADPVGAKQVMAWLSDEPMIYDKLTPIEYLHFVAGLWAVEVTSPRQGRAI